VRSSICTPVLFAARDGAAVSYTLGVEAEAGVLSLRGVIETLRDATRKSALHSVSTFDLRRLQTEARSALATSEKFLRGRLAAARAALADADALASQSSTTEQQGAVAAAVGALRFRLLAASAAED
jgi:hypothetical protein